VSPEESITASLAASPRPLSFTELTHPVRRATGTWPSRGDMQTVLTRLVARRKIVRRPLVPPGVEAPRSLREMDVALCDYHPAGRDAFVDWRPCPACGRYVAGDAVCGEPCEGRA
jgi:hypothetical protein